MSFAQSSSLQSPVKILLVAGSTRRPSHTFSLVEQVRLSLEERGAQCHHWDIDARPLPEADPSYHERPESHPGASVRELVAAAASSDAFVLGSPIYHNGYSAVLKNILDLLTIPHFQYKAVALVSHGDDRSTQAVDQLRIVVRGLHGYAAITQICTAADDYAPATDGRYPICAPDIRVRIDRLSLELMLLAQLYRVLRAQIGLD